MPTRGVPSPRKAAIYKSAALRKDYVLYCSDDDNDNHNDNDDDDGANLLCPREEFFYAAKIQK